MPLCILLDNIADYRYYYNYDYYNTRSLCTVLIGHAFVCCTYLDNVMFLSLECYHNIKHVLLLRFDSKPILRSYLPKSDRHCVPTNSMVTQDIFTRDWSDPSRKGRSNPIRLGFLSDSSPLVYHSVFYMCASRSYFKCSGRMQHMSYLPYITSLQLWKTIGDTHNPHAYWFPFRGGVGNISTGI